MNRRIARAGALAAVVIGTTLAAAGVLASAPASDPLPPEKQAFENFANANRLAGSPHDKAADKGAPLVIQTDAPPITGLIDVLDAPISGEAFTPTNAWAGWIDATYVRVWVGGPPDDPATGLVLVIRRPGSNGQIDYSASGDQSLLPVPIDGPLKIESVDGSDLVIAGPSGKAVWFDATSGTFH